MMTRKSMPSSCRPGASLEMLMESNTGPRVRLTLGQIWSEGTKEELHRFHPSRSVRPGC